MTALLNTTYRKSMLATLFVSLMLCASCTDEDMVQTPHHSNQISFGTSISDKWNTGEARSEVKNEKTYDACQFDNSELWLITTTEKNTDTACRPTSLSRGAEITENNFYNTFGVYAYTYSKNESWNKANEVKLYAHDNVSKNTGSNVWSYDPVRFWPGANYNMKFLAYAPESMNPIVTGKQLSVSHTVKENVEEQEDLLLAIHDRVDGNTNSTFNLRFEHILTAVKVKVAAGVKGKITNISFKNINRVGNHSFTENEEIWGIASNSEHLTCDDVWTESSDPTNFDLAVSDGELTESEFLVTDDEHIFMMIPQELGDNAELVVTFEGGKTIRGSLSGKVWPIGHTVTYIISLTEFVWDFDVTISNQITAASSQATVNYQGGELNLNVTSIKTTLKNSGQIKKEQIPWKIVKIETTDNQSFFERPLDDAISEWFDSNNSIPQEGSVSLTDNVKVNQQLFRRKYIPNLEYGSFGDKVGIETNPYNLSNQSSNGGAGIENTANCYIIKAPGVYSIPLIYGNAIKNGSDNKLAYNQQKSNNSLQDKILQTFKNHNNEDITSPVIQNAVTAELVWQDEPGLITNIQLVDNTDTSTDGIIKPVKKVVFTTNDNLLQGNAVVAVKDAGGTVLWSWHLWFTPKGLGNEGGEVAQYNLGWCESFFKVVYPERQIKITFQQDETNVQKEILIIQQVYEEENPGNKVYGNNVYYQWGRKDPFPGNTGAEAPAKNVMWDFVDGLVYLTTNKPIYNLNNQMLRFWDGLTDVDRRYDSPEKRRIVLDIYNKMKDKRTIGNVIQNPDVFYSPGTYLDTESPVTGLDGKKIYPNPAQPANIFPGYYGGGNHSWNANAYLNLWDTNLTVSDNKVSLTNTTHYKTIYDPCPVGYRVPSYEEFDDFVGKSYTTQFEFNAENFPYVEIEGYKFHIIGGRRVSCGQVVRATNPKDSRGHYWLIESATPDTGGIYELEVFGESMKETINGQQVYMRPRILTCAYSDALSIRPVKE